MWDYDTGKNALAATGTTDFNTSSFGAIRRKLHAPAKRLKGADSGRQARWPQRDSDPGFLRIKGGWELWKWKDPRSLSSLLFAQPALGVFPTHNQFTYSCVLISNYYLLDSLSISTGETQCQTLFQKQGCNPKC